MSEHDISADAALEDLTDLYGKIDTLYDPRPSKIQIRTLINSAYLAGAKRQKVAGRITVPRELTE